MRKEIEAIYKKYAGSVPELSVEKLMIDELAALFESKLEEKLDRLVGFSTDDSEHREVDRKAMVFLSDHEKLRREHWSRAYVRFMELFRDVKDAEPFANQALEAFDNKFNHQP